MAWGGMIWTSLRLLQYSWPRTALHNQKEIEDDLLPEGLRFKGPLGYHLSRNSCNFAHILRISVHGPSDLLSPLYDASRAQVTLVQ